ncbi:MAG: DNA polymerase III subunit alpha [Phycisphaerales bacterium]|nr:DNA polymerase III subunit alpha [Phycisphaerales bacterium]
MTHEPNSPAYAELDAMSNFSFLEGGSHPEEIVERAADLGLTAIGLADRGTMSGMVRAHGAAKERGIPLLVGGRLDLLLDPSGRVGAKDTECDALDSIEVIAYATDRASYGNLCRAITQGRMRTEAHDTDGIAERTQWHLPLHDFLALSGGLELLVVAPRGARLLSPRLVEVLTGIARRAPGRTWLVVARVGEAEENLFIAQCGWLSRECGVPLVAAQGVRFHDPARRRLHDVLTAIRCGTTVAAVGFAALPNAERHLRDGTAMHARWREYPEALAHTLEIARRCSGFSLSQLRYRYPRESATEGIPAIASLRLRALAGAAERYPSGVPDGVRAQLEGELAIIKELEYEPYFLTVHDIVRFARSRGILCQGRGAAANSVVCYCLGVTAVDPARFNLLFERFVSRERQEPPDIDIDFEHERREEVIQFIYERYGRHRAAICAAVICFRRRLAVRETAKALGFSLDAVDRLAHGLSSHPCDDEVRGLGFDPASPVMRALLELSQEIEGFPRHLSQHTGGFVVTEDPLCEMVPIRDASMDGRTMIEWDKDDIDAIGMLKIDILALGMLTCIRKALDLAGMSAVPGGGSLTRELALHTIPAEDPATYEMVCAADTVGVFQIESRAQMAMLPRLRPKNFYDLVIEVALVRPGPIQGDMVHPYLRRRAGEEEVEYPNEAVRRILERTLGIPLFQEQAMSVAMVAAGFSAGEADQLRRSIASWKRSGKLVESFRERLEQGMLSRGYSLTFAQQVFRQLHGFASYGFPESHAASFALLVYASAWLKRHRPAAFTAALLNSQPMGFYGPSQLVQDATRHGVEVRGIDVSASRWDCTLEGPPDALALRLGMRMVRGLTKEDAQAIVAAMVRRGRCDSVEDLWRESGASIAGIRRLACADAFQSMGLKRQGAIWQAQRLRSVVVRGRVAEDAPLFTAPGLPDTTDRLPPMSHCAQVEADYHHNGLSLKGHPMEFVRQSLARQGIARCGEIADDGAFVQGARTAVAGIVLLRQRPSTAKGIVFITLEDESGTANLIVRPKVWERNRAVGRTASALVAHGTVQRRHESTHLIVGRLARLSLAGAAG